MGSTIGSRHEIFSYSACWKAQFQVLKNSELARLRAVLDTRSRRKMPPVLLWANGQVPVTLRPGDADSEHLRHTEISHCSTLNDMQRSASVVPTPITLFDGQKCLLSSTAP